MFLNAASRRMPALFTRMSTCPNASMAAATIAAPPASVATESPLATAVPPAAVISSTTLWAADCRGAAAVHCAAQIIDHDAGTPPRELQRVASAESAPCAGDDGYLVVESH